MLDDGVSGDEMAEDQVFGVIVFYQDKEQFIQYFVVVENDWMVVFLFECVLFEYYIMVIIDVID